MSKVKVPEVFDKWYKQVEEMSDGFHVDARAVYLIAAQGFGHGVATFDNVLQFNFDLSSEEVAEITKFVTLNKENAIRAILDGYEVDEQLYHIIFPGLNDEYLNYSKRTGHLWLSNEEEGEYAKTKFTMDFIEENFPQYKQFAVGVGFDD